MFRSRQDDIGFKNAMKTEKQVKDKIDKLMELKELNIALKDSTWSHWQEHYDPHYLQGYIDALLWVRNINGYCNDSSTKQRIVRIKELVNLLMDNGALDT